MSTIEKNENEANCVEMSSMDKDITAKYGLPFIKKGENIFAINLGFFSAKIQKVCDLIYYKEEWFEWENDHWKRLDETKLQNQIWNQLNTAIQNAGLQLYDKITPRIIQDI